MSDDQSNNKPMKRLSETQLAALRETAETPLRSRINWATNALIYGSRHLEVTIKSLFRAKLIRPPQVGERGLQITDRGETTLAWHDEKKLKDKDDDS